ncbi:MAG: hypothetical protein KDE51_12220 [Anaerolineales bacterium]|nr:hypothetical protein [Anaerolineales bacterium]
MNSKNFFVRLLINGVLGLMIGAAVLSMIGYLLAGNEGLLNGAALGAIVGLLGGLTAVGNLEGFGWTMGTIRRYGEHRHKEDMSS